MQTAIVHLLSTCVSPSSVACWDFAGSRHYLTSWVEARTLAGSSGALGRPLQWGASQRSFCDRGPSLLGPGGTRRVRSAQLVKPRCAACRASRLSSKSPFRFTPAPFIISSMESLFSYVAPPSQCGYLPDESWSLEYEMARDLDGPEYRRRLLAGWRRFGAVLFRPRCLTCNQCQALRVDVGRFQPNRSQRRTLVHNQNEVTLQIGCPGVSCAS